MTQPTLGFEPEPADDPTLTVTELNDRIGRAVRAAFRHKVWVRGEIQGLGRPSAAGHLYFSLVDGSSGRHHADAVLRVALFNRTRETVERLLRRRGGLTLADGMAVRIEGQVEYHSPSGQLSLRMTGIDPEHTLGRMALDRDRLLRVLAAEGLLERNRGLALPLVPLRVGLVASTGTAGYTDVLTHLAESGIGWHVVVSDARVQGASASRSVARAIRRLGPAGVDVILVIRGGGSRSDLAVFDAEPIARAIAASPVPVLTGIGHEVDTSVADAVAHTSCKTPTACAAHLVEHVRGVHARTEATWRAVRHHAERSLRAADAGVEARARTLAGATQAALDLADQRVVHAGRTIGRDARVTLARAERRLGRLAGGAEAAVTTRLRHEQRAVATAGRRVRRHAPRAVGEAERRLAALESRARAADPQRLLALGWSLTTTADGRALRSVEGLAPGATLRTTLADGTVTSRVEAVDVDPPAEEARP